MKTIVLTGILLAVTSTALAGHERHYDYGEVKHVEPIYETHTRKVPREQCWVETVHYEREAPNRSATPTIVGGIIGAAVGNRVGHSKRNKQVGAVAGAVLGASIGHDIGRRRADRHSVTEMRDVERCETRYHYQTEERIVGYDVTYKYRGERFHTTMDHHPGKRIKLAVSVHPVH
ncbi:glycine zipper 2TM domain-containing protein [Proteobacteria bacterium 005FR1]|nr:glycine zipper 2TM domain-containing protein [Proteobacteria bacterium 005FR1]